MDCECLKKRAKSTTELNTTEQIINTNKIDEFRRNTYGALTSLKYPDIGGVGGLLNKRLNVICEHAISTSSYCIIKHVPLKLVRFGQSTPNISGNETGQNLQIQPNPLRRDSFLYKYDDSSSIYSCSRQTSTTSSTTNSEEPNRQNEDIIVTPYAQILSNMRKVRTNVLEMSKLLTISNTPEIPTETSLNSKLGVDTLDMLDWCLDYLESIETHNSVGTLATEKFKKMLNIELQNYDYQTNSTDHQLTNYIVTTFLNEPIEIEDIVSETNTKHKMINSESNECLDEDADDSDDVQAVKLKELRKKFESDLYKWNLDVFDIEDSSQGNALVLVCLTIFKRRHFFNQFQINPKNALNFLQKIQETYRPLPYHNSIHAADVTHSANIMLNCTAFQNLFTNLEVFAVIFACLIHDVDHPGLTNQYLINIGDTLATFYNDQSVLENHHLSTAFNIMKDKECNLISGLNKQEHQTFRKLVIDIVLATDMSYHMSLLADLKTMVETKKVTVSGVLNMDSYNNRKQILQCLVHCCDISNPTKSLSIYEQWIGRIMEEFFRQGDCEKKQGLDISPMCDRDTANINKTQLGFIDFVVHPLWEAWCDLVYPDCQLPLETMCINRKYFSQKLYDQTVIQEVNEEQEN